MVETITNHNSKNLQTSKYRYDNDIQKLMEVRIVVLYVNTIFNNVSVLLVRETEYPVKTTDLPQVTD